MPSSVAPVETAIFWPGPVYRLPATSESSRSFRNTELKIALSARGVRAAARRGAPCHRRRREYQTRCRSPVSPPRVASRAKPRGESAAEAHRKKSLVLPERRFRHRGRNASPPTQPAPPSPRGNIARETAMTWIEDERFRHREMQYSESRPT